LDPLNWEIKLRKGVKFTNGEPLNADAVTESFKHMTRPQSQERARFQSWESISKVDDYTLRVKTVAPDPRFVTVLVSLLIMPPQSVPLVERGANTKLIWVPSTRNVTIIFDQRSAPFNDVRVRQAMNYAIDKESINRNILGGRGLIQGTASHPSTFGHNAE